MYAKKNLYVPVLPQEWCNQNLPAGKAGAVDNEVYSPFFTGGLPGGKRRCKCPESNAPGKKCAPGESIPVNQKANRVLILFRRILASSGRQRNY